MMVDRVDIEVDNLMTNQVDGKSILMLRGITGFSYASYYENWLA